jgi:hypothetical protein
VSRSEGPRGAVLPLFSSHAAHFFAAVSRERHSNRRLRRFSRESIASHRCKRYIEPMKFSVVLAGALTTTVFACANSDAVVPDAVPAETGSGIDAGNKDASPGSMRVCKTECATDTECSSTCPDPGTGAVYCCDAKVKKCYTAKNSCPVPQVNAPDSGMSMYP